MRTAARLFSWSLSARVPSRQPSTSTSAVEKTRASLCGGMSLSSAVRLKGSVLGIKYLCRLTLKRRGVRLKIMRDKILKYGKYSNPRTDPATDPAMGKIVKRVEKHILFIKSFFSLFVSGEGVTPC